jgi:DNA helicase HerA-like ATPase
MTHFIMRIVNPIDQASVASAVESVGRDLLDELPALSKGQVVIAGASLNTPVICQTRPRYTRHGGTSVDAVHAWEQYFHDEAARSRDVGVVDGQNGGRSRLFRTERP